MTKFQRMHGLLALLFLAGASGDAAIKPDWSKVRAIQPGRVAVVLLYEDAAPAGSRKIKGLFSSATDESVTLAMKNGQSRTAEKRAVRKVLVRRPFAKRYLGWIAAGVSAAVIELGLSDDLSAEARILHAAVTLPAAALLFYGSRMGGVYNVPPKHRSSP